MNRQQKTFSPRVLVQVVMFIVVIPLLPLLISQRWDWWEAWIYALICIAGFVISRILAARRHPDLLAERAQFTRHENTETWDKILVSLVGLGGALIPLSAGLAARLGMLASFSLPVKLGALLAILAGYVLGAYALIENRYFSGVVRLQTDRGHQVVASGPYRWVRHPGYAGAILMNLATPLFLGTLWTFAPVLFLSVVLVLRTALEDSTLQERLSGYRAYAQRVPYRLLPGIW